MQKSDMQDLAYADDEDHPIPFLQNLDVHAITKHGESNLVIVVASPLQSDERSQRRLLQKLENCLGFIASDACRTGIGEPSPSQTTIVVRIHADSDPLVFDLLTNCASWISDCNASLVVERI